MLEENRMRFGVATMLSVAMAGLVSVALAVVLSIQVFVGGAATSALFREKGDLLIELISSQVREQLDPASAQLSFLAEVLGKTDAAYDEARVIDLLTGALAGAPNIFGVLFVPANGRAIIIERGPDAPEILSIDTEADGNLRIASDQAATRRTGWWGELVFAPRIGGTIVNRRHPVWRDGVYVGLLGAVVPLRQLSAIVERSAAGEYAGTPFILYGPDRVLAHRRLLRPFAGLTPEHPLPTLAELGDSVLAEIWSERRAAPLLRTSETAHAVPVGGTPYLFLHAKLTEFGDTPWIVGAHFRVDDIAGNLRTAILAGIAGLCVLLVAIPTALILARRVTRPTRRFAAAAQALADLDFSKASPLPASRIRELDEQAQAFNRLLGALRWFEAYVPRNLVRKLAREAPPESEERILTVMFTDLAGFTSLSQDMPPAQVAELLNAHFAEIIRAVEESGGTVDKFMGDGTMAFWGAPDRLKGHARRALACAADLESSVAGTGLRLRVGIHTGRVVVGNVGSQARLNYTIVGDAVNATQRIEQLGKELMGADERSCILASADTWEAADRPAEWTRVGEFTLRGRDAPVAIYRHVPARAAAR
jgi:adenylate cyclase